MGADRLFDRRTLPPERVKNASGLFNLTRNLGGAVGLAGLTTILFVALAGLAVTIERPPVRAA
jgi:hypothetical protein